MKPSGSPASPCTLLTLFALVGPFLIALDSWNCLQGEAQLKLLSQPCCHTISFRLCDCLFVSSLSTLVRKRGLDHCTCSLSEDFCFANNCSNSSHPNQGLPSSAHWLRHASCQIIPGWFSEIPCIQEEMGARREPGESLREHVAIQWGHCISERATALSWRFLKMWH